MFTIFNTASSFYWYPTKFRANSKQYESIYIKYKFDNGMVFNAHNFLYQSMDFAYNNNTALFLTDVLSAGELFEDTYAPRTATKLTKIISPLADQYGYTLTLSSVRINNQIKTCVCGTRRNTVSEQDILQFSISENDDGTLSVRDKNNDFVLQSSGTGPNSTFFASQKYPEPNNQKFNYYLSDDGQLCLFAVGSNNSLALTLIDNILCLKQIAIPSYNYRIPNEIIFKLQSYKKTPISSNSIINSKIVEYDNTPITSTDSLNKKESVYNKPYFQNYLAIFPGEVPQIIDEEAVYDGDFLSLKNYQTSEYDYTNATTYVNENSYIRRLYWKIHTGTNQEGGHDQIYLGYTTNTDKMVFYPDRETAFEYPPNASRIPLSSSNLIQNGAIAGSMPLISDRIYALSQNYNNTIPTGFQPVSFIRETGTWLCSWFKKHSDGKTEWMDRYYNAGYYTIDQALSSAPMSVYDRLDQGKAYVYDVPSTMIMEPGAHYKYFRQGIRSAGSFLRYLDYIPENRLGSKILDIKDWSKSQLMDSSPYGNNGFLINYTPGPKNYFIFNGSNHIVFPAKSQMQENNQFTISLWLNPENWSNITGWQIIGNYYEGGWGLINSDGQIAPLLTMYENKSRRTYTLNYRSGLTDSFEMNEEFDYVMRLQNFNYWLINSETRKMFLVDINGKIIKDNSLVLSSNITDITQIETDVDESLYFRDKNKGRTLKLNANGDKISLIVGKYYNRLEINLDSKLVYCDGSCSVIDNSNKLWEVIGENLYVSSNYDSNTKYYLTKDIKGYVGRCQQITCDGENNIWLLTWDNIVIKYNTQKEFFEVKKQLLNDLADPCNQIDQYSYISFYRTQARELNAECVELQKDLYDIVVIVDTLHFKMYKYQTNGSLISRTDIRGYIGEEEGNRFDDDWQFNLKGDFTGYNYIRKFSSPNSKKLEWKLKVTDPIKSDSKNLTLSYCVSGLPPGWHNFVLSFDTLKGECSYYIDSIKVDTKTFPKNYILAYKYASPILVGAASVRNTSLNDVLSIEDGYKYEGKMSELKMYTKCLKDQEILQLYFASPFSIPRPPLEWNVIMGEKNYVERIEHLFKYNMPGSKSNYYDINIHNFRVSGVLKKEIEKSIRNNIQKITPSNTYLNNIKWI